MVNETLEQAWKLKQAVVNFVIDAEGELATALEAYAANRSRSASSGESRSGVNPLHSSSTGELRAPKVGIPQGLIVDAFLTEGRVGDQTPLEMFLMEHSELSELDRKLIHNWQRTFTGLFEIESVLPDSFELLNWLTAKRYTAKPASDKDADELARLKPGEILLTRITPVTDAFWMFTAPYVMLGKLGKPKLAVAIGNFRENHKSSLYSNAPELLEEAWQSVDKYYQAFLDFFGSDEITMSGYQLSQKIPEFQQLLTQRQLKAAGIDTSKSIAEIMAEADVDQTDLEAIAEEMGVDAAEVSQVIDTASNPAMMTPQVKLPDAIKKAEQVTVLADPRWGQMFLPHHSKIKAILEAEDWQSVEGAEKIIRHYLDDPSTNLFVWQRLATQYPQSLETVVQVVLQRPNFQLQQDLSELLREQGKPIEPVLPEIASVPLHLHDLFEEAVMEVNKSKPKGKAKTKKTGFGAK
jgi:hypothetical protein